MAQLITVRLNKSDQQPLGFRLQGGKDFGTPLVVQKVNGGSAAERAGLQAGDALIRVNNTEVYTLRHQEAQDTIRAAGPALELTVQRGGGTWRPSVTATGSLPRPGSKPLGASPTPVTNTSLKATPQPSRAFGSGHNSVAKPFGYMNGTDKGIVNKQYNTPVNMYSDKVIAETLSAQTEVLAGGVLGVNFKKNEKTYDAEKSAVFKVFQEEQNDPEPAEAPSAPTTPVSGLRHVSAPVAKPDVPVNTGGLPVGQNICEECERLITGVFVRIKDKNLHVECFKCSTCGSSLKNQGYYNLNGKLYCDIHAKLVARQNPPASNLEPVTVPPGGRIPTNSYTTPLPPLSTGNYTNGSSSLFSPSSNLSGPKPFGSSIGSAYSPSLSPRSAPMSPARPVTASAHIPAPAAPLSAPFAPKAPVSIFKAKNVKSIVWPPPNPPEDETPLQTSSESAPNNPTGDSISFSTGTLLRKATESNVEKDQIVSGDQFISTSQETAFSSSVSFSSASMSTATTTSSFSKSSVQSEKSQEEKEFSSCTVQSFSEQASSEGQTYMMYQTQAPGFQMIDSNQTKHMEKSMHDTKGYSSNVKSTVKTFPSSMDNAAIHSSSSYSHKTQPQISQNKGCFNANNTETQYTSTDFGNNTTHTKLQNITTSSQGNQGKSLTSLKSSQKEASQTCQASRSGQVKPSVSRPSNNNSKLVTPTSEKKSDVSPMVKALTTIPDRPFTPINNTCRIESNLLKDNDLSSCLSMYDSNLKDFGSISSQAQPIVNILETKDLQEQQSYNSSTINTSNNLQSTSQVSAFRPVGKYSPQLMDCTTINSSMNTQSVSSKAQTATTSVLSNKETTHTSQSYFEQVNQKQSSISTTASSKLSILQQGDTQLNKSDILSKSEFKQVDLPKIVNAFNVSQETFIPVVNPSSSHITSSQKTNYPKIVAPAPLRPLSKDQHIKPPVRESPKPSKSNISPISTSSQPVSDEQMNTVRTSPPRSRPSTPSLINKPAPIIPHYQMNLVTMEHFAPESHTYQPAGEEGNRTPTPKPRSRTPAQGPSFKAQAPRIKDSPLCNFSQSETFSHQLPSTFQKDLYSTQMQPNFNENRPPVVKEEKRSNFESQSENYKKGGMSIKQDSMMNQNYGQRQMESQNVAEYGHTTVQTTRKTFEEYESSQSAKMIEIQKGGFASSDSYQPIEAFDRPPAINSQQTLPSPAMSFSPSVQNFSSNITNENVDTTRQTHTSTFEVSPSISGANRGPVCDPTPSTGSSIGAAARGKTFGVSSAPKRGRGVLNKAVLPGSRVPLCGSCNGNIRCFVFLTANETQNAPSSHKMEFKSPAEERLIRKMAKMALNGYEIGIQRKIKPADHIQSMADRIQDTIVTNHPLNNSDNMPSGENSRDNTLTRPSKKLSGFKHDSFQNLSPKFVSNSDEAPVPPPLPTTPIPIFNNHNTMNNSLIIDDSILKSGKIWNHSEKIQNSNGYSSSEESKHNKMENNFMNSLTPKAGFNKSYLQESTPHYESNKSDVKLNNVYSNTMSKRKLFERSDAINDTCSSLDYSTTNKSTDASKSVSEKKCFPNSISNKHNINGKDFKGQEKIDDTRIQTHPNSLHDNSLYTYSTSPKNENNHSLKNNHETNGHDHLDANTNNNDPEEVVVRRREKKNIKKDDGRRDSHIIARPLSTMTSVDVSDGQYVCNVCEKVITRGPFITALGRIWCPEHFICVNASCRRPLQDIGFVEENGQLYCEYCFEQYIAPACDKCHAKIKGDCLNAIGKHFHPECFSCVYCGHLFGNNPFFLEDGLPYCEADWNELFTTKCFACGFPVEAGDRWVEALNNNYHSQCFNCTVCKKNLEGQSFFAKGGRPFCKIHAR